MQFESFLIVINVHLHHVIISEYLLLSLTLLNDLNYDFVNLIMQFVTSVTPINI